MAVLTLRPNSDSGTQELTVHSDPNHYANVDEITEDVGDYNQGYTAGPFDLKDRYGLTNHGSEAGSISSVVVKAHVYANESYMYVKLGVKIGTTDYGMTQQTLSASDVIYSETITDGGDATKNPDSHVAWTWTDIDALVAVCNLLSTYSGTRYSQVYQLWVEVTYSAALTIGPSGIASLEAFGADKLNLKLLLSGLPSLEALGSARILFFVADPPAIGTAEAFGAPLTIAGIFPSSISPPSPQFGSPQLLFRLFPDAIVSLEAFGLARVVYTTQILASYIATAQAFGTAFVLPGPVNVLPSSIASPSPQFGNAHITTVLLPAALPSVGAFGNVQVGVFYVDNKIVNLRPIGDSGTQQLSIFPVSPTTHYDKVDEEIANAYTDVVFLNSTSYLTDRYFIAPHTDQHGTITDVRVYADILGLGGGYVKLGLNIGGTDYGMTQQTIPSSSPWSYYYQSFTKYPVDNTAWTWARIDNLIATLSMVGYTAQANWCTQLFVAVYHYSLTWPLKPSGISSGEAAGTPLLALSNVLQPSGIPSLESIGAALVMIEQFLAPGGIDSLEVVGAAKVVKDWQGLIASGIASSEAIGDSRIGLYLLPSGTISQEILGNARLNLILHASGLATGESFGTPTIRWYLYPASINTAEAFGLAQIIKMLQFIAPAAIVTTEAFGAVKVQLRLRLTGISTAEAFGTAHLITWLQILAPGAIMTAEVFGSTVVLTAIMLPPVRIDRPKRLLNALRNLPSDREDGIRRMP